MPFIANAWYVAALSEEVTEVLFSRTLLDTPILLYRQAQNGGVAALMDLCPHRFAPLSMGVLKDGHVQCPYHGLEFDRTGRCVHNPHGNGARPSSLDVRSYPVVERDGLVWTWLGEREKANPALIPDYSCRIDPQRRTVGGYAHVESNYRLLVDNLMDLGHAQFVHRANAQSDAFDRVRREVVVDGTTIHNNMMFPETSPTVFAVKVLGPINHPLDQWTNIRWNPVGAMLNLVGFAPVGTPIEESANTMGTHVVTPETEGSCHYFFGASRNFALDDDGMDEVYRAWQRQALTLEDKPMVQAIQALAPVIARHQLRPAILSCDEAAVRVSRELDHMERLEI